MTDWFKKIMIDTDDPEIYIDVSGKPCGRPDIDKVWNEDVEKYREFSIKRHNDIEERGTDQYCVTIFLNWYSTAINVFDFHSEMNGKPSFNRLIESAWNEINVR